MAMLAEPRRKQKWSVDPRNSTWSNDESKVGQKMLEKMGWSKGKGLGAKEQGNTEHIKVQVKNNTLGLGASINNEDNWVAHQDDFNQILAELNSCHGSATDESPASDSKKSFSLEEKSKASRKRVHYMKFAKGKDLSCRSDTDLDCIFGKRRSQKKSLEEEANTSPEELESPSPPSGVDPGNTVTSSLSVNEYFAKRMAELKKSQTKLAERVLDTAETIADENQECSSQETKKKSKKKKRSKNKDSASLAGAEEPELRGDANGEEHVPETRERAKSQRVDEEMEANSEEQEEEERAQDEKKKKKKQKRKTLDYENEDEPPAHIEENSDEKPKKKKKKKSKH